MAEAANPVKTAMTWEQFLAAGEERQRWELVEGAQLEFYSNLRREWIALGADTAFTIAPGTWRCPDAALVRAERFPGRQLPEGPAEFPPDVAFEVLSPGDTARRMPRKRRQYQESGVIHVWIDFAKRTAEAAYPDRGSHYFDEGKPLTIDGVDGFALDLKALFEV
ncbi:MAG TPA: Uma2 family endonuclease [Terriglobia bacterium]|nr:Uma2 family endonuclease [Terriglobia bacterium]